TSPAKPAPTGMPAPATRRTWLRADPLLHQPTHGLVAERGGLRAAVLGDDCSGGRPLACSCLEARAAGHRRDEAAAEGVAGARRIDRIDHKCGHLDHSP